MNKEKILKSDASAYLVKLRKHFSFTKPAMLESQLSKLLEIPIWFVEKFIQTVKNTDYFNITNSPTGRIKKIQFNKYSEKIFFISYCCGIKRGEIKIGNPNGPRNYYERLDHWELEDLKLYEDEAANVGAYFVDSELSDELFVKIFIKEMQLELLDAVSTEPSNEFENFPLVKAEIEKYEKLLTKLENEVAEEIALNERNAKWFKEESYKAQHGLRRKNEAYSIQVGTEERVNVTYARYWFDDDPTPEYSTYHVPKYETRYRSVIDYPEKPEVYNDAQRNNAEPIRKYKEKLKYLKTNKITSEKRLAEEKAKDEKVQALLKQKKEIERQISNLK